MSVAVLLLIECNVWLMATTSHQKNRICVSKVCMVSMHMNHPVQQIDMDLDIEVDIDIDIDVYRNVHTTHHTSPHTCKHLQRPV